jgi:hypothetical protein
MAAFAERTGLTSSAPARRYLWTDAFAVCNYLGLSRATGKKRYDDLALDLVDQVHSVLGRYHPEDPRSGWISGLGEEEGAAHPTRGGLRIGKPLPERGPGEPFDEHLEWDRDGQYFHYLTKWMHALDQMSRSTGDPRFNLWARELAVAAHAGFVHGGPGHRRMAWKMSTDLSRPLVDSMGQHDPLDGYVTGLQLGSTAKRSGSADSGPSLMRAVEDYRALSEAIDLRTADPLGLGGLLTDAFRIVQLAGEEALEDGWLLAGLLVAALDGLERYGRLGAWHEPAVRRLAFRELGLAIGLAAGELLDHAMLAVSSRPEYASFRDRLEALKVFVPLGQAFESFWLDPAHRQTSAWADHRDINEVMLATRLVPSGYLVLGPLADEEASGSPIGL